MHSIVGSNKLIAACAKVADQGGQVHDTRAKAVLPQICPAMILSHHELQARILTSRIAGHQLRLES